MSRLICVFVVRIRLKTGFLMIWLTCADLPLVFLSILSLTTYVSINHELRYRTTQDHSHNTGEATSNYTWYNVTRKQMSRVMTKPTKWLCAQQRLRSAWRKLGSLATHWEHSEDSDQTGRMPRLIWVFAGCTVTLLVLSRLWWKTMIRNRYNSASDIERERNAYSWDGIK